MIGLSATTGALIEGDAHLAQSVRDILSTPIGSRVARRDYGSEVPALIDQAWNAVTRLRLFAATAMALLRWEPRLRLTAVAVAAVAPAGAFVLTIDASRTDTPVPTTIRIDVPLAQGAAAATA